MAQYLSEVVTDKPGLLVVPRGALDGTRESIKMANLFGGINGGKILDWEADGKEESRVHSVEELNTYKLVIVTISELQTRSARMHEMSDNAFLLRANYLEKLGRDDNLPKPLSLARHPCSLLLVDWAIVAVDEAHTMRNDEKTAFRSCTDLKAEARLAVTGTFLVNYQDDISSLFRFLRIEPFYSNPDVFKRAFLPPKKRGQRPLLANTYSDLLSLIMAAFTIRRFHGEVFEGEVIASQNFKWEETINVHLRYPMERTIQAKTKHLWAGDEPTKRPKGQGTGKKGEAFEMLHEARHFLLHPAISKEVVIEALNETYDTSEDDSHDDSHDEAKKARERKRKRNQRKVKQKKAKSKAKVPEEVPEEVPEDKLTREQLREKIRNWDKDDIKGWRTSIMLEAMETLYEKLGFGAILYCEWVAGLDVARVAIEEEFPDHPIFEYIGDMNDEERAEASKKFDDACLRMMTDETGKYLAPFFLLSPAGGVGLNVPNPSCMIHLSAYWNWVTKIQATFRAIRHGRNHPFYCALLRPEKSISKHMDNLTNHKKALIDAMMIGHLDLVHLESAAIRAEDPERWMG
jgi:hypothetical protein